MVFALILTYTTNTEFAFISNNTYSFYFPGLIVNVADYEIKGIMGFSTSVGNILN